MPVEVSAQEGVEAAHSAFGRHPGHRALHAKGTVLRGTFTATPQAARLTRAAHMQGELVAITARVSNGAGNPEHPDYIPDVRGLAVKFYLPDGSRTDIVAQSAPRFPVHGPAQFVELLRAQERTPASLLRMTKLLARNPGTLARLPANLATLRPPSSYAACDYYAVHAFRFLDAKGGSRYVRYTWKAQEPAARLSTKEARRRGRDYLQEEIRERVESGGARFTLELQIAGGGDRVDDPAAAWPSDRQRVPAGTLKLSGLDTEREQGDDVLVFDPTRVTDGIECSDDPVLLYRPKAYDASVKERMGS